MKKNFTFLKIAIQFKEAFDTTNDVQFELVNTVE